MLAHLAALSEPAKSICQAGESALGLEANVRCWRLGGRQLGSCVSGSPLTAAAAEVNSDAPQVARRAGEAAVAANHMARPLAAATAKSAGV